MAVHLKTLMGSHRSPVRTRPRLPYRTTTAQVLQGSRALGASVYSLCEADKVLTDHSLSTRLLDALYLRIGYIEDLTAKTLLATDNPKFRADIGLRHILKPIRWKGCSVFNHS